MKKKYDLTNMDAVEIYKLVLNRDIKIFPKGFWMQPEARQNAIKITKYLLEDILHYTHDDIKTKVNTYTFNDNRLSGMLVIVFGNSVYSCINSVYPDKFKEWQLSYVPHGFWNKDTAKEATKWLLEEKLHYTKEDIKTKVNTYTFNDNRLNGMLEIVFDGSTYECINNTYPGEIKQWELSIAPNRFWNKDTAKEATKWLLEEKLHYSEIDIKTKVIHKPFRDNGLKSMIDIVFSGSLKKCLYNAYPELFEDEE